MLYFTQQSLQFRVLSVRFGGPLFPEVNTNSERCVSSATGNTTTYFNTVVYILNLIFKINNLGTATTVDIQQADVGHNTFWNWPCVYILWEFPKDLGLAVVLPEWQKWKIHMHSYRKCWCNASKLTEQISLCGFLFFLGGGRGETAPSGPGAPHSRGF